MLHPILWDNVSIQRLHSVRLQIWLLFNFSHDNCMSYATYNTRKNLLLSNTWIQLEYTYASIFFCFITMIVGTWHTLDAEIDAASNTGNILSASNTCIQLCCIYACFHCCWYMVIGCTGNTLYSDNTAASDTLKLYGCIHTFEQGVIILGKYTKFMHKRCKMQQYQFFKIA